MIITRPLLACKAPPPEQIKYPIAATPKIDGFRCLVLNGQALSRTFKPIRNHYVRAMLETHLINNFDGELIVPGLPFNEVSSALSRADGQPDFRYLIFDCLDSPSSDYVSRVNHLEQKTLHSWCQRIIPVILTCADYYLRYEEQCIIQGFEGVCYRRLDSPYKCGRSTLNESFLVKDKRTLDSEATIVGFVESMENQNEAVCNALGLTQRSSCAANKVPKGTLGTLLVKDCKTGVELSIPNFTQSLRDEIWANRPSYLGRIITYTYQPHGTKDKPRHPRFKGFRTDHLPEE